MDSAYDLDLPKLNERSEPLDEERKYCLHMFYKCKLHQNLANYCIKSLCITVKPLFTYSIALLESDVHAWTSKMSTRGRLK